MGPRSLLREVLGEPPSSLSLGTGSVGAVDLLLVLFKKKRKYIFLKKGLLVLGPVPDGLGQLPDCCFNLKKKKKKVGQKIV